MTLTAIELILFGIGAWMLMDGIVFGLLPDFMRRMSEYLANVEDSEITRAGLLTAAAGAAIVFVTLRF
ncbi:MAG: DUF2065 family protein [Pseudomonadota bacterium]